MALVLQALRAALSFVFLHEIPQILPRFLDHLARPNTHVRPKKSALFSGSAQPVTG